MSTIKTIAIMLMIFLSAVYIANILNQYLMRIDSMIFDTREIESEIRDSNWIMACDDVSKTDYPETYAHCQ